MKEAFKDLQIVFPDMPAACEHALMAAVHSVPVKASQRTFRPAFALALALTLALTCAAGAAFYPQIIGWFTNQYGENWGAWLQQGSVAAPQITAEAEGAVFTVDEVLVRGRGLYMLGSIRPQDGYEIADYDTHRNPSEGKTLRYVHCGLEQIGVDGGAMLAPSTWGYAVEEKPDGSLAFSIEVEDGMTIEPGMEYTIEMYAHIYGTNADGSVNPEDREEAVWAFTVKPEKFTD